MGSFAGTGGDVPPPVVLSTAPPGGPSKALLDAVFPPVNGRRPAWAEDDGGDGGNGGQASSAGRSSTVRLSSRRARLTAGRRGPGRTARASPAASSPAYAATRFPLPDGHAPPRAGAGSTASPADMTAASNQGAAGASSFLGSDSAQPSHADTVKLRNLLDAYGEFPGKYRLLVWRKMLRLPNNEQAYDALASKVQGHPKPLTLNTTLNPKPKTLNT